MRTILIIGAGRSASSLIQYLLNKSVKENLHLVIGDLSLDLAQKKTNNHPNATAIALDIFDEDQRKKAIQIADIISVAYAYAFKNNDDFSKQVKDIGEEFYIEGNVIPDFDYLKFEKSSVQLNIMILQELYFRSKKKIPLLLNF